MSDTNNSLALVNPLTSTDAAPEGDVMGGERMTPEILRQLALNHDGTSICHHLRGCIFRLWVCAGFQCVRLELPSVDHVVYGLPLFPCLRQLVTRSFFPGFIQFYPF